MTIPPDLLEEIREIERILQTLPLDAPGRRGFEITHRELQWKATAPILTGGVQAERDVNVAGIQVIVNGAAGGQASAQRRYRYCEILALQLGGMAPEDRARLPAERQGYLEKRTLATMRRWKHLDPKAMLRRLRVELINGTIAWGRIEPPQLEDALPLAAERMSALLIWPLLYQTDGRLREDIGQTIAVLCSEDLAGIFDNFYLLWDQRPDNNERTALIFDVAEFLGQPLYREGLLRLYEYLCDVHVWREANEEWTTLSQTGSALVAVSSVVPTARPAPQLAVPIGSTAAPAGAAAATRPRVRPNTIVTESGDLRLPIAADQWRFEYQERDTEPRPFAPADDPLPYWCYVPPSPADREYRIGGWKPGDSVGEFALSTPFWIARIPITVSQYTPFLKVGYRQDGEADGWWTPNGAKWRRDSRRQQPDTWQQAGFDHGSQPITGVAWYEAVAFVRWLQSLHPELEAHGLELRLPTDAEWEIAAAYTTPGALRRVYPWGDEEPASDRAAWQSPYDQGPPTVGSCPRGAAACGALDLAGTIWEYQASSYSAYAARGDIPRPDFLGRDDDVACRGGSYAESEAAQIRCAARRRLAPGQSNKAIGFRIVLASLSN